MLFPKYFKEIFFSLFLLLLYKNSYIDPFGKGTFIASSE